MPYKGLIRKSHITEKAAMLKSENKYVFEVDEKPIKAKLKIA